MKMIKVKSSNIRSVGYSANLFQLVVEFKATDRSKAKVFTYEDVSPSEYDALMNADSVGKHFNSYIKRVKEGREIKEFGAKEKELSPPAASPWISVDDAMPEGRKSVDVWSGKHRFTDCFYCTETEKWYDEEYGTEIDNVNHWMPLTEPPTA